MFRSERILLERHSHENTFLRFFFKLVTFEKYFSLDKENVGLLVHYLGAITKNAKLVQLGQSFADISWRSFTN